MRLSPAVLLAAVVLLLGFASGAGAALPPEGLWQWAAPYAPEDPGHAGRLTQIAAGPNDSIYVGGGRGGWVLSRVVAATGAEIWSQTLDPSSPGGSLSAIAADASGNVVAAGRYGTRGGDVLVWKCRASDGETLSWTRWTAA